MSKFVCTSFRSVTAEGPREAAQVFALRAARKAYGKRGNFHHVRLDSWTEDGQTHVYEAFIGVYRNHGREMAGHNIWLHVHTKLIRAALAEEQGE